MNALLTISGILFPLISFPYISRVLLPEGTGKITFATSLVTYFNMFAQLEIPTYGIRACAKVRENKEVLTQTVHELLLVSTILSLASYGVLAFVVNVVPKFQEERLLCLIVGLSVLFNAIGVEWLYKALEKYAYIMARSIVFKVIALVAMLLMVRQQEDYLIYGGLSIFASSSSNILNLINLKKHIAFRRCKKYDIKRHIKPIAIFFAMSCATTIYTNMDTLILGLMASNQDVGYYNAAIRIKSVLVAVITSMGAVLLPRASLYVEKQGD